MSHFFQVFVDSVIVCVTYFPGVCRHYHSLCRTVSRCLWTVSFSVSHSFQVFVDTVILCVAHFPGVCGHCHSLCHTVSRCLWTLSFSVLHSFLVFVDTVILCVAQFPGFCGHCNSLCRTVSRCLWNQSFWCLRTLSFSVLHSFQVFVESVILCVIVCVTLFPGVCQHCHSLCRTVSRCLWTL